MRPDPVFIANCRTMLALASSALCHRGDSRPILSCQQVQRLEEVFQLLDQQLKSKKCPGIDEILQEGREIMEEFKGRPALDAGLLAGAQAHALRHVIAWSQKLGLTENREPALSVRGYGTSKASGMFC
jgi:ferritin-like metal-binding protein YciE